MQSKYFSVGSVVPWAEAGVGAVATQAAGVAAYGARALAELRAGVAPDEALRRVLADDEGRATRQLGVVTADGPLGRRRGPSASRGPATAPARATPCRATSSPERPSSPRWNAPGWRRAALAAAPARRRARGGPGGGRRLAGPAVGGDRRRARGRGGRRERGHPTRICELRVEDHVQPIVELRRLLRIWERWDAMRASWNAAERGDVAAAAAHAERRSPRPGRPECPSTTSRATGRSPDGRGGARVLGRSLPLDESLREQRARIPTSSPADREEYRRAAGSLTSAALPPRVLSYARRLRPQRGTHRRRQRRSSPPW